MQDDKEYILWDAELLSADKFIVETGFSSQIMNS